MSHRAGSALVFVMDVLKLTERNVLVTTERKIIVVKNDLLVCDFDGFVFVCCVHIGVRVAKWPNVEIPHLRDTADSGRQKVLATATG
jgi:hypothetical protein